MAGVEKYEIPALPCPEVFHFGPEIDRETARSLGRNRFFTGEPCLKNHVAERWTSNGTCIQCVLERHRTRAYRTHINPVAATWVQANPDRIDAYNAKRRAKAEAVAPKSEARREGLKRHWAERKAKAA
ncbi:hypothetical protein [Paracoccus sp. KR1-242]|uniref:hypothetical protein n=1 Tax=Paracoccus sp. KR1-242 TaxID=3410028 RepID=UPI003C0DBF42